MVCKQARKNTRVHKAMSVRPPAGPAQHAAGRASSPLGRQSGAQPAVHLCASVTVTGPRLLSDDLSKSAWNFSVSQCPRDTDHDFLTPIIWNVFSV